LAIEEMRNGFIDLFEEFNILHQLTNSKNNQGKNQNFYFRKNLFYILIDTVGGKKSGTVRIKWTHFYNYFIV
jgi:hypothetical protein